MADELDPERFREIKNASEDAAEAYKRMRLEATQRSATEDMILDILGGQKEIAAQILDLHVKSENNLSKTAEIQSEIAEISMGAKEARQSEVRSFVEILGLQKDILPYTEQIMQIEELKADITERYFGANIEIRDQLISQLDLAQQQYEQAQKTYEVNERMEKIMGVMDDHMGGIASAAVGFASSMLANPFIAIFAAGAAILASVVSLLKGIQGAAADWRVETGLTLNQTEQIQEVAREVWRQHRDIGVTLDEIFGSATAWHGVMSQAISPTRSVLENITLLQENFSVAEETTAGVLANIMAMSGTSESLSQWLLNSTVQLAEARNVAPKGVLEDIVNSAEQAHMFFRGNKELMLASAIEARRFNIGLQDAASTAESLLDFESSITSEMKASVLIGRQLNFARARQLAFDGNILEARQEIIDQIQRSGNFLSRNVIEQQAIAEAAGMTVSEIRRHIMLQERLGRLGPGLRETYESLTEEQRNQLDLSGDIASQISSIEGQSRNTKDSFELMLASLSSVVTDIREALLPLLEDRLPALMGNITDFINNDLRPLIESITEPDITGFQRSFRLFNWIKRFTGLGPGQADVDTEGRIGALDQFPERLQARQDASRFSRELVRGSQQQVERLLSMEKKLDELNETISNLAFDVNLDGKRVGDGIARAKPKL